MSNQRVSSLGRYRDAGTTTSTVVNVPGAFLAHLRDFVIEVPTSVAHRPAPSKM